MNEVEKSTEKSWLKTNPEKGLWSYLVIQNNLQAELCHWYNGQNNCEVWKGFYCPTIES